ncbi:MAG: hypothetical protein ABI811_08060 [Acidobacteriota bacterium]
MRQIVLIVSAALVMFGLVAAIMLRFMPEPLTDSDYFVVGTVATLVALLVVFVGVVSTKMKGQDVFFKRREKR